jgi:hypothetical protein
MNIKDPKENNLRLLHVSDFSPQLVVAIITVVEHFLLLAEIVLHLLAHV